MRVTMLRGKRLWLAVTVMVVMLVPAAAAQAQEVKSSGVAAGLLGRADSAFHACDAAATAKNEALATWLAARADTLYDAARQVGAPVADVLTGHGNVISTCRIPFASMFRQAALVGESNDLAERAIAADSLHLGAHFLAAMNDFYTPSFLGRTDAATAGFEWVVAHYGNRPDVRVGLSYLHLGDLYERAHRAPAAVRVWQKGAAAFPELAGQFQERLAKAGARTTSMGPAGAPEGLPGQVDDAAAEPQAAVALTPLVVEASTFSVDDPRSGTALSRMDVVTLPGGTADVLQVFQTVPGATRLGDGSDLYVRGGDAAEAPVIIDGARVPYAGSYESLHGGTFGIMETSVISKAFFSSGGFSARWGNALSGVLDLESEGRPTGARREAGANLVSVQGNVHEPLGPATGFWASGKVTETTALLGMQGRRAEYPSAPRGVQGTAAYVYAPLPGVDVKAEVIGAADGARVHLETRGYEGALDSRGRTGLAILSARALRPDGRAALKLVGAAGVRSTGFTLGVLDRSRNDRTASIRLDAERAPSNRLTLRSGVEAATLDAKLTGAVPTTEALSPGSPAARLDDATAGAQQVGGYAEAEVRAAEPVALTVGARGDRLPGESGWSVDPRAAIAVRLGDWTLRAGGGLFHQGRWRMGYTLPDGGSPSGVPTRARHLVAGAQREGRLSVRVEGFLKRYDGYASPAQLPDPTAGLVANGPMTRRSDGRGVDALIRWTGAGRLNGWIAYSYLDLRSTLADGREVAAPRDVKHSATGVARLALAKAWELGSTLRYGSGAPFSPVTDTLIDASGHVNPVYGAIDAQRLPDYLRLDGRLTHLRSVRGHALALYLEALNVLDRKNVMAYTYDASYRERRAVVSFFARRTLVFGADVQI